MDEDTATMMAYLAPIRQQVGSNTFAHDHHVLQCITINDEISIADGIDTACIATKLRSAFLVVLASTRWPNLFHSGICAKDAVAAKEKTS